MKQATLNDNCAGVTKGSVVLVIGEIDNMTGHYAFVDSRGIVHWGYHEYHFNYDDEVL